MINRIQNETRFWQELGIDPPSIVITAQDAGWDEAYHRWLDGKTPTDSKEWKRGIYASQDPRRPDEDVEDWDEPGWYDELTGD